MSNSKEYKSLKMFGKEYYEEEKGSTIRGPLYAMPLSVLGAAGAIAAGTKIIPLAKRSPSFIRKGLKSVWDKTNPARLVDSKMFNSRMFDDMFTKNKIDKDEYMQYMKDKLSDPKVRLGGAGAGIGWWTGATVGNIHGTAKGLRDTEEKHGFNKSTVPQLIGRGVAGSAMDSTSTALGLLLGGKLHKAIPTPRNDLKVGKVPVTSALKAGKYLLTYGIPVWAGSRIGEATGEYLTSRYLQKHTPIQSDDKKA